MEPTRTARAAVLGSAALTIMAAAVIAPALPAMAGSFGPVPARLTLTVTSLAIAVTAPIAGTLADRLGRRPVLLAALALYAVAGTAGLVLDDLGPLIVSRIVLGAAVGGIMTSVGALITDWFDGPRRAAYLGYQQAFASLGGIVFLPLAGVLAGLSWHAPFAVYAAALLVLPLAAAVREPERATARTPASGFLDRRVAGIYLLTFTATVAFFMAPTQLPFWLPEFGAGTALIGAVVAGTTLTGALGAVLFPRVRRRVPPGVITAVSLALLGAGWLLVGAAGALPPLVAGVLIGGTGVGLVVPNLNLRLSELAPPQSRGRVLSGLVVAVFLGQFVSPLATQPLIDGFGIGGAFTATGAALLAGAAALLVPTRRREQ